MPFKYTNLDEDTEEQQREQRIEQQEKQAKIETLEFYFQISFLLLFLVAFHLFMNRKKRTVINKSNIINLSNKVLNNLKIWENKSFNFVVNEIFQPSRMFWITIFVGIIIFFYTKNSLQNVLLFAVAMIVLWNTREIYLRNKKKDE